MLRDCLRASLPAGCLLALLIGLDLAIFLLYGLPTEPFVYTAVLTGVAALLLFGLRYARALRAARERARLAASIATQWAALPEPRTLEQRELYAMLETLGRRAEALNAEAAAERRELADRYTAWVHQIKTPIAVLRMRPESAEPAIAAELFRIEQYAEMALQFIRLDCDTNDLVVREHELDELIRSCLRRYAPLFIARRLRLEFTPTGRRIVTDSKWFCCILEQLLSNAVKYTPEGSVRIRADEHGRLQISDTGIGIAPEDLPRIFEKGYTGSNGRTDRSSSGLGLYLAGRAAEKLALRLSAESTPGKGSSFTIELGE